MYLTDQKVLRVTKNAENKWLFLKEIIEEKTLTSFFLIIESYPTHLKGVHSNELPRL